LHQSLVIALYEKLIAATQAGGIPIQLAPKSIVGTVQDDPFDRWVEAQIIASLPGIEVNHSGSLTTPDLVLRDPKNRTILGLEIKKLIQKPSGADARGLTLDFNSCVPCGKALVRIGADTIEIPCFYLLCLLSQDSDAIVTMILMDGDCLNYEIELHKESKIANISEYGHGPYGEGSVRRRAMYLYPNPLNHKLPFFHLRKIVVMKKHDADNLGLSGRITHLIRRDDKYNNSFLYAIVDFTSAPATEDPPLLTDIFAACKARMPKPRTPSMPMLKPL
jgi:hypothetical protein